MEITGAFIVAILCASAGFVGLQFVKDAQERSLLVRLFFVAFSLRLVFIVVFYATGLVYVLGGADDSGWVSNWSLSRHWGASGPDSFWNLYDPAVIRTNPGWDYFATFFYYLLDMRSQTALAVFNGFLNSLTVLVIYMVAREFFSRKASLFAAGVAVVMPGFLIWSALTIKETWLILFEITAFYVVWRMSRQWDLPSFVPHAISLFLLVAITLTFRFYVAGFLVVGIVITMMCFRARRPLRAAGIGLLVSTSLYVILAVGGLIQFDLISVTQARIHEVEEFRRNISDASQSGTGSAIQFNFDTTTPEGAAMMVGVGSVYLLLSPFPWQIRSFGEAAALPDVLLWWWLVFVLIIPGIGYAWRRNQATVLSIAAFVLPLFLFYAFMFGNVGLAYRQRAQLMPFLLVLAAAGQEKRLQKKRAGRTKKPHRRPSHFTEGQSLVPATHFKSKR